jgi:hypothetical protein
MGDWQDTGLEWCPARNVVSEALSAAVIALGAPAYFTPGRCRRCLSSWW